MILPSLAITAGSIAVYYRLLRSDLISTLQEDFITMARSKGLANRRIMWRHAFRPVLVLPAGRGRRQHRGPDRRHVHRRVPLRHRRPRATRWSPAVQQRDYLVVQGIALVVAIAYVVLQFIIDFVFTVVDPRVTRE